MSNCGRLRLVVAAWIGVLAAHLIPCPAMEMQELIAEVEAQEELYRNIEVRLRFEYRSFHEPWQGQLCSGGTVLSKASEVCAIHGVLQDGMFRVDVDAEAVVGPERKADRQRSSRRFDGTLSRVLMQDMKVANIIDEPSYERFPIRPHMFLYTSQHLPYALSALLKGRSAIDATAAFRHRGPYPVAEIAGFEQQNGLICHVVTLRFVPEDAKAPSRVERLWLAIDRNLLPVRYEEYQPNVSATLPDCVGTVDELHQIQPGVWMPARVVKTLYNRQILRETGRQQPGWQSIITVEFARLDPQYPVSYFNTLEIPEGTYVYHVRQKKIVRSYIHSAPGSAVPNAANARKPPYWLWLALGIVGLTVSVCLVRRLASRKGKVQSVAV